MNRGWKLKLNRTENKANNSENDAFSWSIFLFFLFLISPFCSNYWNSWIEKCYNHRAISAFEILSTCWAIGLYKRKKDFFGLAEQIWLWKFSILSTRLRIAWQMRPPTPDFLKHSPLLSGVTKYLLSPVYKHAYCVKSLLLYLKIKKKKKKKKINIPDLRKMISG